MTLPETAELSVRDNRILRYCRYGPPDGVPVVVHNGTPSSRWKWPRLVDAMDRSGLRLLVYDRPGYGGSSRQPGRTVADAAEDVRALADAQGWARFAVFGGSGGGPHALACAALLADRVTRCAVVSGIRPAEDPERARDEPALRSRLAEVAADILRAVDAGGPELPTEPGPPARTDPDAMARIRATFVDGMDGWADDSIALARPWGFAPDAVGVPVGIWRGTDDPHVSAEHADWLLAHVPTAEPHVYAGGHLPGPDVYDRIHAWLRAGT
ncbi:alpha/beta fold hydrolase [Actinocatenispora rupis]|uniref:Alpha/beta hydrolase n=1 Tax=Actinocatenispora rupis TaxID=519421 RepID=A0A8J3J4N2_9ACTN|nr:alpha/beta fold hydrolase [Actinocatenispora rupis]GID10074.1 alpha/beta hydrolase [Actinocatenispora rupis]